MLPGEKRILGLEKGVQFLCSGTDLGLCVDDVSCWDGQGSLVEADGPNETGGSHRSPENGSIDQPMVSDRYALDSVDFLGLHVPHREFSVLISPLHEDCPAHFIYTFTPVDRQRNQVSPNLLAGRDFGELGLGPPSRSRDSVEPRADADDGCPMDEALDQPT